MEHLVLVVLLVAPVCAYILIKLEVKKWDSKAKKQGSMTSPPPSLLSYPNVSQLYRQGATIHLSSPSVPSPSEKKSQSKGPPDQVLGFRIWLLEQTGEDKWPRLYALNKDYHEWLPGTNEARCLAISAHRLAPASQCGCGFWIKNSMLGALKYAGFPGVLGVVQGWGHVLEHEDGWRAQYASVVALSAVSVVSTTPPYHNDPPPIWDETVKRLAMRFDVPAMHMLELQREYEPEAVGPPWGPLRVELKCNRCFHTVLLEGVDALRWELMAGSMCMAPIPLDRPICKGTMRRIS